MAQPKVENGSELDVHR